MTRAPTAFLSAVRASFVTFVGCFEILCRRWRRIFNHCGRIAHSETSSGTMLSQTASWSCRRNWPSSLQTCPPYFAHTFVRLLASTPALTVSGVILRSEQQLLVPFTLATPCLTPIAPSLSLHPSTSSLWTCARAISRSCGQRRRKRSSRSREEEESPHQSHQRWSKHRRSSKSNALFFHVHTYPRFCGVVRGLWEARAFLRETQTRLVLFAWETCCRRVSGGRGQRRRNGPRYTPRPSTRLVVYRPPSFRRRFAFCVGEFGTRPLPTR